jgi:chloramphenicol 3-O-phosphotransferase
MTGEIILLTGSPGAGKSTVAALVATDAAGPAVHLTTDLYYRAIKTGFVPPYMPGAQKQNEVVVDAIVATATTYARGGYDIVVDGIIGPWFLKPFQAAAEQVPMSYVVLRPDLETTLARAQQRADTELKDVEAITGMYDAFKDLGELERHVIDTSALDAEQTAAEVRRAVASKQFRLA